MGLNTTFPRPHQYCSSKEALATWSVITDLEHLERTGGSPVLQANEEKETRKEQGRAKSKDADGQWNVYLLSWSSEMLIDMVEFMLTAEWVVNGSSTALSSLMNECVWIKTFWV